MKIGEPERIVEARDVLKSGLTWRTLLAVLYGAIVLSPMVLYFSLVAGIGLAGSTMYITTVLFAEIARMVGAPLRKQELFIMYSLVSVAAAQIVTSPTTGGGAPFLTFVFRSYFLNSPVTYSFLDPYTGRPLPLVAPNWYAPPVGSSAYYGLGVGTLIHPDWLLPLGVTAAAAICLLASEIGLALMLSQIYIDVEKLPYPMAAVDAEICLTLAERGPDRTRVFAGAAGVGIAYGIILHGIPILLSSMFGMEARIIPIPWVDLSIYVEKVLPGATFGFWSDILAYITGFILPFNVVIWMFIGSISLWFFGNHLALRPPFSEYFPEWGNVLKGWSPGSNITTIYQRSYFYNWLSPLIGLSIGAATVLLVSRWRYVVQGFRTMIKLPTARRAAGYPPFWILASLFLGGSIGKVLLVSFLVPEFPAWIFTLEAIGWTFIYAVANARSLGEAGVSFSVPYVREGIFIASGYPKSDVWFTPIVSGGALASNWTHIVKVAYLTDTRPIDFFKTYLIIVPITWVASLIYVQAFWSMAPIPSSTYLWTTVTWPVDVATSAAWITREVTVLKPLWILGGFCIITALSTAFMILRVPFSIIGFVAGANTLPPATTAYLIGGLVGKYIFQRALGREWFNNYKTVIAAGVATGEGVIVGIATALALTAKAMWVLPY